MVSGNIRVVCAADKEMPVLQLPSPLVQIFDERLSSNARLFLKRDDLIHPELPGNKWRKLQYNIEAARAGGYSQLLTFGGAYSNHIRATAAAGYYFGFDTIGVIRGEEHRPLNPSLRYAVSRGMRLVYLDRVTYRQKTAPAVVGQLQDEFGRFYLLPEGGSNALAVRGCRDLPAEIEVAFDLICCPCGTGGTLAGIAAGIPSGTRALGFSALKGGDFLRGDVEMLQRSELGFVTENWSIESEYHFGGFAKRTAQLEDFIADFDRRHGVLLDWVYVAKMMYGIFDLVYKRRVERGTTIVAVITGPAS